jgi:hypothetical protein
VGITGHFGPPRTLEWPWKCYSQIFIINFYCGRLFPEITDSYWPAKVFKANFWPFYSKNSAHLFKSLARPILMLSKSSPYSKQYWRQRIYYILNYQKTFKIRTSVNSIASNQLNFLVVQIIGALPAKSNAPSILPTILLVNSWTRLPSFPLAKDRAILVCSLALLWACRLAGVRVHRFDFSQQLTDIFCC